MSDPHHIAKILTEEEGFVPHAYQDHLGFWTIGHGILIDERKGGGITESESEYLMRNRIMRAMTELDRRLVWWRSMPVSVMDALVLMAYQMGMDGVLGFKNMLAAMERRDWERAAEEALDSEWYREQTPARAERVAAMIKGGSSAEV